jgi:hypothetical protein
MRVAAATLALLLNASSLFASHNCTNPTENVITTIEIGMSGYTLSSTGTAKAVYYSSGNEVLSCEHLGGRHFITSDAGTITESVSFRVDSRAYNGTIYSSSEAGTCYQARIDATTEYTGQNQGAGSASRCRPSGTGGQVISQLCLSSWTSAAMALRRPD